MKWGTEPHEPRDFRRAEGFRKAEAKQKPVTRVELIESCFERSDLLGREQFRFRVGSCRVGEVLELVVARNEHRELSSYAPYVLRLGVRGIRAEPAEAHAVVIEAKSPRDYHEPCGEFAPAITNELSKAPEVVASKVIEDIRITIHDRVMVAAEHAARVHEEVGVLGDKPGPANLTPPLVGRLE